MMKLIALPSAIGLLITLCLHTTPAQALEARTWVSTAGNDASDCSRATPCASFLTAHNKTLPGGEINCVDAGMFSIDFPLNITKSITIDCAGTLGGLMGNANGEVITINTANINVRLRNLTINGLGANFIGINFQNGNALFVENCTIFGFNGGVGHGISFKPANGFTSQLYVTDSVVEGNGLFSGSGGGIIIQPSGSGSARVVIDRTRVNSNIYGIFANGTGSTGTIAVQVKDSTVSGNAFNGISAFTSAGHSITSITVDHSSSLLNGANGILAQGQGGFVFVKDSTVMSNVTGLRAVSGGAIFSYQNNALTGNVTDGAPTNVVTLK